MGACYIVSCCPTECGTEIEIYVYYYIRDYWGLEAKVRVSFRGCQYSVVFFPSNK